MLRDPVIVVERYAVPIVRTLAIVLENAGKIPSIAGKMVELEGAVAFKSGTDRQAASAAFNLGEITVSKGVSADALITAEIDPNWPIVLGPDVHITGSEEYPQFTADIRHIFSGHYIDWFEAAENFWTLYSNREDLPQAVRVQCTDDNREIILGKGSIQLHILGNSSALASIFTCSSMLIRSVITGEIRAVGELKYLSTLTGVYFDRITGALS